VNKCSGCPGEPKGPIANPTHMFRRKRAAFGSFGRDEDEFDRLGYRFMLLNLGAARLDDAVDHRIVAAMAASL
jgi:hypothetical protein